MANPSHATVTIDGNKFDALSTHVGISTTHDGTGMPLMGTLVSSISLTVDIHDKQNMPFATLQQIFGLANGVIRSKIRLIRIEYWVDESQQDAICVYQFEGWISNFSTSSGATSNHLLNLTLQPIIDSKNFIDIKMSN